jgi:DNA-3-methyladenine glycosylase I
MPARTRCTWGDRDPLYRAYHDEEWGVPLHDDRALFEFVVLEGAQAGLSWRTILGKRDRYRQVFARFDPRRVARFGAADVRRLLNDPGIVRNRLKITAAIDNARAVLALHRDGTSLDQHLWSFVGGAPIQNRWRTLRDVPAKTAEAEAMSRDLTKRGFRFVGPTICYALMQATGMVNDHTVDCFRHRQLAGRR